MDSGALVSQAVGLIRTGQAAEARQILLQVLKDEPQNENGWLWLVQTLPNDAQRIAALERCLKFNPGSQKARLGLDRLCAAQALPPSTAGHTCAGYSSSGNLTPRCRALISTKKPGLPQNRLKKSPPVRLNHSCK